MNLREATEDDNDRLLHYFTQSVLPGPIHYRLRRMFNFFNQYRIQSDDFTTLILENEQHNIEALASLIFREGYIENQKTNIGYATDLRVSPTRKAITGWSQHFLPVLEAERQKHNCQIMFSVVAHAQRQAYNAFIRPRNIRRNLPRYHLFRRFRVVQLHGLWPFHNKPLTGIKIRTAQENDLAQVAEYIIRKTSPSPLRYFSTTEEFKKHLERWRDLKITHFLLAFDKHNNLIGCTAPWSAERIQRVMVIEYNEKSKNMQDFLRLLSIFNLTHPLPKPGRELEVRHLTHLHADNPDIFYSLLFNAFQMAGKNETLMYPHFEGELVSLPPSSFIYSDTKFGLYCVLSPTDPIPGFLRPRSMQAPPVFEPALL